MALDPERALDQYNFKQWGVEAQLPQITVKALSQDDKGYIWIGTQNGVARFNGKDFVTYNRENTNAFQSNIIADLLFDSQKRLWILNDKGLLVHSSQGFEAIKDADGLLLKPHSLIEFNHHIIMSTANGLFKVSDGNLLPFLIDDESFALKLSKIGLIVGGRGQFHIIKDDKVETIKLPLDYNHAVINDMQYLDNAVWLATSKGLFYYQQGEFFFPNEISPLIKAPTNKIYLDENKILWVATDYSAYRIKNKRIHKASRNYQYARINEFLLDRDDTLWLGTSDKGLFQLWDSWSARFGELHGVEENLIWSVAGDKASNLIIGSDNAVYKYSKGGFEKFIVKEQLPNPTAYTLLIDKDDSIWVGTKGGIAHFDKTGATIPLKSNFLNGLQVNAIYRDSKNNLWVATQKGLYRQNEIGFVLVNTNSDYSKRVFRTIIEYQHELYFGTQTGLLKLSNTLKLQPVLGKANQFFITSMAVVDDMLIAGTYSEGLFIKSEKGWSNINKGLGLLTNDSFSITEYNKNIWVSGFHGVYKLSIKQIKQFVLRSITRVKSESILKDSGYLPGSQHTRCCNGGGNAKASLVDGSIWFPTLDGVLKLDPHKVKKNDVLVETQIESVTSSGQTFDLYSFNPNNKNHGEIGFDEKDINFKFIGMTSFDEGLVHYRYRLLGYNDQWKDNHTSRDVFYTNLPAGKYSFEVMASNNNGLWPTSGTVFKFIINPMYYETLYFKIAVVLAVILLLYLLYQWKIFTNRKKVERLENLVNKKTKELTLSNAELEKANLKLSVYSYTDPLTGAFNRRYLQKQMKSDVSHYARQYRQSADEQNMVFILADLDFFKDVNDKFGHAAGDEVLAKVVECLRGSIRDGDYLIRWGGEEFLIVLRPNHVSDIELFCDRLLEDIRRCKIVTSKQETIKITFSLGYCFYPLKESLIKDWSWESAVNIADKALYESKSRGRNQWVGYQLMPHIIDEYSESNKHQLDINSFQRFTGSGKDKL